MKKDTKKIAIVRLSALGDIINSAVVLQFIKQFFPNAHIQWITEEMFAPLLYDAKYLDGIDTVNIKQLKKEKSFHNLRVMVKKLRSLGEFDLIIDMQGLLKSAIVARLIGKNTHGFDANSTRESLAALLYKTTSSIPYETGVITRNTFLVGDALGFCITDTMILHKEAVFEVKHTFDLPQKKKHIACVIGASWESKIYPKEQMASVCSGLDGVCHIIWGNEKEQQDALWISQHATNAIVAPQMDLSELVSFISHVDLVIGNDTGPTHLAWAQNIPSITLFGPTNERMIYQTPNNIAIKSPSSVNILKIDKNDFSLREIEPQTIITAAKELLA